MGLIYSDNPERGGPSSVPYEQWRANDRYLEHYANMLTLTFIANATRDAREKVQANTELVIANTKMRFWQHHMNYDQNVVTRGIEKLKASWNGRAR